jgi:carbonic anhydrase/acetyltransferase-like protein (isoleucine patch superfamily)
MIKKFRGKSPIIPDSCYISESVDLIGDVTLGENVSIWFGTVVRGDMHHITIGNRSNIQDNSVIHVTTDISPTRIGDEVTVGHNAIIHGATIEDRCLIGMGSIIMDDVVVGEGSIVGAGAVVPPNMIIPPRSLVVGLPAKIVRQTTDEELEMIIERAQHYIDFSQEYKNQS